MRHRLAGRHLGRPTDHRLSLYRNLVTDLLRYERITTTEAKAKEIRPMAEKVITLGKRGDLHARRQAHRFVYDGKVVKKVFDDIAPRFASRAGGYTRITALEARKGDGARMAMIELIDYVEAPPTPRPQRVTASPGVAQRPPASVTPPVVPPSVPEEMEPEDALVEPADQDTDAETADVAEERSDASVTPPVVPPSVPEEMAPDEALVTPADQDVDEPASAEAPADEAEASVASAEDAAETEAAAEAPAGEPAAEAADEDSSAAEEAEEEDKP